MNNWPLSADLFGFDDTQIIDLLYQNGNIHSFLESNDSMGIASCKGMGKTFLLKAKRMQMQDSSNGYLLLPKNQIVDTPNTIVLESVHIKFLSSYSNWVSIWIACISIYLLSLNELKGTYNETEISKLPGFIQDLIKNEQLGVYHVLAQVIYFSKKSNLRDVARSSVILAPLLQRINRPVALFIDKLEEPFNRGFYKINGSSDAAEGRYNASIWAYSQLAFAEAVYILYSGRHHVKIFYSIRQEALYGFEEITREHSKIVGDMICEIKYTHEDLYKLFVKYIDFYKVSKNKKLFSSDHEGISPTYALCGIDQINHRSGTIESMWAYLYRHSLQRPRDIMDMASTIADNIIYDDKLRSDEAGRIRVCRHWINQVATRICTEYLSNLEPFMGVEDNICFKQDIFNFIKLLPTNVFTPEVVISYCHLANINFNKCTCSECKEIHYFSTLYNIGLLGCIYKSMSETGYKNHIKHIGDSVYSLTAQTLPEGVLYYAHPGLSNLIKEERIKAMRLYEPSNIVINSSEVFACEKQVHFLRHFSTALWGNTQEKRVFITSTQRDLADYREKIKSLLEQKGYTVLMYESPGFPELKGGYGLGETHDHCIDVMLTCKHLIYIFGARYGGQYAGERYQQYIDEQKIIEITPSVSFVEYLVAKKFGKNTKVYVDERVDMGRVEYLRNRDVEGYKSPSVERHEVYTQLKYFNSLGNATWYDKYFSLNNLEQYIDAHFKEDFNETF